jgi:shikimate kinase
MYMDSTNNSDKQSRPRIVEIVGPAGAGKTTLCQMLSCCEDIQVVNFPDVQNLASLPFFANHGLRVLASVLRTQPDSLNQLHRWELGSLSILNGWSQRLQRESRKHNDLILLDRGPIFLLSEMSLFGPHFLRTKNAQGLWRTWYHQWASVLDAVVWLDASDECLWQRIRTREKDHPVKTQSARRVLKFLKEYRRAYEHILSALSVDHRCFKVLRFDTSRYAPEEIAAEIFCEFDLQTIPSVDY